MVRVCYWDKESPINGHDAAFISEHFKSQNGNDDRICVYLNDELAYIEPTDKPLSYWQDYYDRMHEGTTEAILYNLREQTKEQDELIVEQFEQQIESDMIIADLTEQLIGGM